MLADVAINEIETPRDYLELVYYFLKLKGH